ncbi:MAG TPA: hypothetical protein VJM31_12540 [Vicinamibacterales bacterium]|nr:hypothetical protein [Vicinamibacterales bacterium]
MPAFLLESLAHIHTELVWRQHSLRLVTSAIAEVAGGNDVGFVRAAPIGDGDQMLCGAFERERSFRWIVCAARGAHVCAAIEAPTLLPIEGDATETTKTTC